MTPDELAAIEARSAKATPGPWVLAYYDGEDWYYTEKVAAGDDGIALVAADDDAVFVAEARSDIPTLLAALEEATALVDDMRNVWGTGLELHQLPADECPACQTMHRRLPWEAPQSRQEPGPT